MDNDGHFTGEAFTVKYHYCTRFDDFIVLKQVFDEALRNKFSIGMKIRCIKNQNLGTIESIEPIDMKFPTSHFMCCQVKYISGNLDTLSPWDLEPLDNQSNINYMVNKKK